MSDYGLLQEVRIVQRGSTLTTAASIGDTELVVDYAGDFNYDPDDPDNSGGTLDLNGTRAEYTSIVFGELPDDPDTIVLAAPLTVAGDADDFVGAVSGGQVGEDWEAHVTMGEGDQVVALLTVDQRAQWPVGVYDDPVPVVISDDLRHIEDAPGRTAPAAVEFLNTDTATITDPVGDQPIVLTYEPRPGSEHIHWHPKGFGGIHLPASAWTRVGRLVTVGALDGQSVDDVFTCEYAYFPGQRGPTGPAITSPDQGEAVDDTTPTITGVGEPGFAIAVEVDASLVGSTTVDTDGTWSVTVGSALSTGGHTAVATQTSTGYTATATSDFTIPAPTPPTPSLIGSAAPGVWDDPTKTLTYAMPTGTAAGDLLVLTVRGQVAAGGGEVIDDVACTDPRMTLAFAASAMNSGHVVVEKVWVGIADGSGSPVLVNVTQNPSYVANGAGVLAVFAGANGAGAVLAAESGTTTPTVAAVAAVAVTWARGSSFLIVNAAPPDGYTDVTSSGSGYFSTDISWWYDPAGTVSPSGTFAGEGCCVIAII